MITRWECRFDDPLSQLAAKHGTDKLKWYTGFYHSLLKDRRNAKKVMELGILNGASLRMWRDYFPLAIVYGLDHDKNALIQENRIYSLWFEQSEVGTYPFGNDYDFIVEDASHQWNHQMTALLALAPILAPGGIYIMEDTGYMPIEEVERKASEIPYPYEVVEFINPELQRMGDRGSCIVVRP